MYKRCFPCCSFVAESTYVPLAHACISIPAKNFSASADTPVACKIKLTNKTLHSNNKPFSFFPPF